MHRIVLLKSQDWTAFLADTPHDQAVKSQGHTVMSMLDHPVKQHDYPVKISLQDYPVKKVRIILLPYSIVLSIHEFLTKGPTA